MESNEASASPEKLSQEPDSREKRTHIRILVSQSLAGYVIGKGGSSISQFQDNSGAQILLSRKREYFPGTTCRIAVISGTTNQVLTALQLVLGRLNSKLQGSDDVELRSTRVVVPHTSCGDIIGKRGATIRSFIEESKAGIKISLLDYTYSGLSDRLVTLSGTMEEQMRAIALILAKLTQDDHYSHQVHSPNSYARFKPVVEGSFSWLYHLLHGSNSVKSHIPLESRKEDNFNTVTIGVSDEHIGLVIGRGGSYIKHISQSSGARIKISGRGEFLPGTTDRLQHVFIRKVTISGLQGSIDCAVSLIERKVSKAQKRARN